MGAPKILAELLKLGCEVSERSVGRYLWRVHRRGDPGQRWLVFLQNHEVIAAFDFFTVPTVAFQLLYCFFVIEHGRRKILHFNVTRHATAEWVFQQLREAFPEAAPYRYVILDHDSKFDAEVIKFLKATGLLPKASSPTSPSNARIVGLVLGLISFLSCTRMVRAAGCICSRAAVAHVDPLGHVLAIDNGGKAVCLCLLKTAGETRKA